MGALSIPFPVLAKRKMARPASLISFQLQRAKFGRLNPKSSRIMPLRKQYGTLTKLNWPAVQIGVRGHPSPPKMELVLFTDLKAMVTRLSSLLGKAELVL